MRWSEISLAQPRSEDGRGSDAEDGLVMIAG